MVTIDHLGTKAQDEISGMEGIITAVAEHLTGCTRVELSPDNTDDTTRRGESEFFYDAQLEVVKNRISNEVDDPVTDVDFEVGEKVRDEVTGFKGIIVTITYELYNCPRIGIQPIETYTSCNQEKAEVEWFDAPRIEYVDDGVAEDFQELAENDNVTETGAPSTDLQRKSDRA